jgi:two-component system, NtrC family, response regulator AtoC
MHEGSTIRVLLIEDEAFDVRRVRSTLRPFVDRIVIEGVVADGNAAMSMLRENPDRFDIVIMDFQIAGGLMGERLIQEIRGLDASLQIIVITKMTINITDYEFANRLMQAGAFWYCTKYPVDIEDHIYQPTDFILSIFNAYEKRRLEKEQSRSQRRLSRTVEGILSGKQILGDSGPMADLRSSVKKCAESSVHVLISGPSGTGKELVAHNIHYQSARKFENFVPVNCGSLPHELIESELFGYEKGAFTGATQRKRGLFEVADRGTLFLDEIGELPQAAQVKLLRVLQEGEIEKIGRIGKIKVDVRIIAATNKDLEREVREGRFREDLFYRLNVLPIHVPALRERKEDLGILVTHFLTAFANDEARPVPILDPGAIQVLAAHDWPGNVRELKNVLQRLVFDGSAVIDARQAGEALGRRISGGGGRSEFMVGLPADQAPIPWREMERKVRETYFRFVRDHSASDAEAAKKLGLAPPNYHRMCKELGMK